MKKIKIIAAILAAAALCGCSDKGNTSSESSVNSVSISSSSAESSAEPSKPESSAAESTTNGTSSETPAPSVPESSETPDENASFLVGLAGDRILKSEITTVITADGSDCDPADLTEELFQAVLCSGFAYLGESSGTARNSIDNADVYDSANMEFTDMSSAPVKNYVRVNVGEKICGMTLEEAEVNFARGSETTVFETADGSNKPGSQLGLPEIYFTGGTAKFSGEVTLEGYISVAPNNDEYMLGVGDIIFVPCDGQPKLPIMSYRLDGVNGFYHASQMYALKKLTWQNEFGYIHLGNVLVTDADTSSIPDDGSFVKATVTIDNYELSCGLSFINSVKAKPVDIDVE